MNKLLPVLFSIFCIGLGACVPYCSEIDWGFSPHEFDRYTINANHLTPNGIAYDPSNQNIDPILIDKIVLEVKDCLGKQFPDGKLSEDVIEKSFCSGSYDIDRKFILKISDDWKYNCDHTMQVLPVPVEAGGIGCEKKGQIPTETCPCLWRGAIRCGNPDPVIIATPSLYIFPDDIVRALTHCQSSWLSAQLSVCAQPQTQPL